MCNNIEKNSNILEDTREVLNNLLETVETNIADSGEKYFFFTFLYNTPKY